MEIIEKKEKRSLLKTSVSALDSYFHKQILTAKGIKSLFSKNQQILGIFCFAIQIVVAVGQVIFGYSLLYTLGYVALYNIWLINNARKRNKEQSREGQES